MNASYADDCAEFTKLMREKLGDKAKKYSKIDVPFIVKMINDELDEFSVAQNEKSASKRLAMSIDAVIDAIYYIYQHLTAVDVNVNKLMKCACDMLLERKENASFIEIIRLEYPLSKHYIQCDCGCLCFTQLDVTPTAARAHVSPDADVGGLIAYVHERCDLLLNTNQQQKDQQQQTYANTLVHIANTLLYVANRLLENNTTVFNTIWKLVHKANMTKFSGDGYLKPDGKWQKPSNFVSPDDEIEKCLIDNKLVDNST